MKYARLQTVEGIRGKIQTRKIYTDTLLEIYSGRNYAQGRLEKLCQRGFIASAGFVYK
jgi:hypothetical protein